MHPEVESDKPGACPKCGMALEPRDLSVSHEHGELDDMSRRLWISAVLSVPVLALAMSEYLPLVRVPPATAKWLELILSTPVVLWGGWPFFVRGWNSIVTRNLNMFTLIALGVGVAYAYSVVALLAPGIFPAALRAANGPDVYFEAAAVITTLVLLGQVLELRARSQTNAAIRSLLELAPKTARLVRSDGSAEDVSLADVH